VQKLLAAALLCAIGSLICGACGSSGQSNAEQPHIKQVSELYRSYVAANRGQLPRDEAALKSYGKSLSPQLLEVMGIKDLDAAFTSPRDGQPYVVVYGASKAMGVIIAHERTGRDGTRLVATREGAAQEVEETEFQKLASEK
jgi:hypothetical protein